MNPALASPSSPGHPARGRLPKNLDLRMDEGDLVLERRWMTPAGAFGAFALQVAALSCLVLAADGQGGRPVRVALFVVVAASLYVAGAVALNRTRVRVGAGRLEVSHGPLPFPGWGPRGRTFERECMSQFLVRANPARRRADLQLRLHDGVDVPLVVFEDADTALNVEHLLRRHMGAPSSGAPTRVRERGLGMLVTGGYLFVLLLLLQHLVLLM